MKNGIIINGKKYITKRIMYNPVYMEDVCEKCALKRRCERSCGLICAPFEKKGYVPYFVKED